VFAFFANAQATFSLDEAKAYAFKYHPNVKNASLEIKKAEHRIDEITSTGLPQINGSFDLNHYFKVPEFPLPEAFGGGTASFVQPHNLTIGAGLNQLIFDGTFFTGLRAARFYKDLKRKEKRQAAVNTQADVEKAYLNALILEENIGLLNKNLPVLERVLFEVQQLYKNGFAEEIEADRLTYSLQEINSQIDILNDNLISAKEFLKFTMGYPMESPIILTDKIDKFLNFDASLLSRDETAKDRIEYEVLAQQNLLNDLQIEATSKGRLPKVYGYANYQLNAQRAKFNYLGFNDDNPWFNTFLIGLKVDIPIFDSFNRRHKIAQSKIDAKQIEIANEIYDKNFSLAIKNSKTAYQSALKQKENAKKNLNLAQKIYDVTLIKYKEGIGSSLEVNDAEGKLLESQNKYLNTLFNLVTAYSDLKAAYGIY